MVRFVEVDAPDEPQAIRRDAGLHRPCSQGALEDIVAAKGTLGEARLTVHFLAQADVRQDAALAILHLTEGDDASASRTLALVFAAALNGWRIGPLAKVLFTGLLQRQCCGAFNCWLR